MSGAFSPFAICSPSGRALSALPVKRAFPGWWVVLQHPGAFVFPPRASAVLVPSVFLSVVLIIITASNITQTNRR